MFWTYTWQLNKSIVAKSSLCRIPHSYALLRRIAPSSVVCPLVSLFVTSSVCHTSELCKKRLKRSSYHLRSGLGWAQWTTSYMRSMGRGNWAGNRQTIVNCRDTPQSSVHVQRRLKLSRCHLGCGLAWAKSITCYVEGPDPPWKGAILVDRGAHCEV